jgi:hypothetical protein
MSAAARVINMPRREADPPIEPKRKPNAPEPRRLKPTSTFTFAATDDLFRDLLRYAADQRKATGEPYSFQAACASLMLDKDAEDVREPIDYQRIWGWTRSQYRKRIEEVERTVEDWRTMYGRSKTADRENHTKATEKPHESHKQPETVQESQGKSHEKATPKPHENPLTNPALQQEGVKQVGETRATAPPQTPPPKPIDPWNPHHAPPDLDAVIGHGAKIGVSAADAEEFYHHYTAAGWRAGNGNAIAHWGSKLKSWSLDTKRKTGSGNGKRDAASAGKPQSSFERRMSGDVIERARESRARLFGLDKPDDGNGGLDPAKRLPG